jgi:Bor protein
MHALLRGLGATSLIACLGCYHATVETGATPSTVVIDKSFASSWIYGLVPPDVVSTASKCTDGVAKVETQHTFVNQLVGFLTLGIYTPMQIKVTCATPGSASAHVGSPEIAIKGTAPAARQEALAEAVVQAARTRKAVYLEFRR